jgi:hypothetical protein
MVKGTVDKLIKELESLRLNFRVRQEEVLADLREAALLEQAVRVAPDFAVGNRVHISSTRNSRPQGCAPTDRDHLATVTRVTPARVYVLTDNGFRTWRARTNVTILGEY